MYDNITCNNTHAIANNINQYTSDVVNNYKTNKVPNLKNMCITCLLVMLLFITILPYTRMIISL